MGVSFFANLTYHFHYPGQILHYIIIGKPDDFQTLLFKPRSAVGVIHFITGM